MGMFQRAVRPVKPASVRRFRPGASGRIAAISLIALVLAGSFAGWWFSQDWAVTDRHEGLISSLYDPPTRPVEAALNQGDGQIFALQASDPFIRRTDLFGSPLPRHHAYRWERPLYGYLGGSPRAETRHGCRRRSSP